MMPKGYSKCHRSLRGCRNVGGRRFAVAEDFFGVRERLSSLAGPGDFQFDFLLPLVSDIRNAAAVKSLSRIESFNGTVPVASERT